MLSVVINKRSPTPVSGTWDAVRPMLAARESLVGWVPDRS